MSKRKSVDDQVTGYICRYLIRMVVDEYSKHDWDHHKVRVFVAKVIKKQNFMRSEYGLEPINPYEVVEHLFNEYRNNVTRDFDKVFNSYEETIKEESQPIAEATHVFVGVSNE